MWVYNASPAVNAASQYKVILGVCLSLTVLMVMTVGMRLVIRARNSRLAAADYVMVVGMTFSMIYSALCIAQSRYGLGLPLKLRPDANLATYTKLNYVGRPFYQIGIAAFKASLCLSYIRLLAGTSKTLYRTIIWVVIAISTLGHIAGALVLIFFCDPVGRAWDTTNSGGCLPIGETFYGLAVFTIICDLMIIFLPVPLLLELKIKPAQKAGVVCLFLMGLFTTICSILRLTQIHRVAFGDGNSTMLVLWGTIEFNIGNIVTCVPYLAPLLRGMARDFRSTIDRKSDSQCRNYTLDTWSKNDHSHVQSHASGPPYTPHVNRKSSEELILRHPELAHGGIELTVEYQVSLESRPTT